MVTEKQTNGLLGALSDQLAGAVEQAGRAVVTVHGRPRRGASGFIWPEDSVIVTANHVLEREQDISVVFADGRQAQASIVGRDGPSDVALLRVDGGLPPAAELAPAGETRVGHFVLALGRPEGAGVQASFGIVSATGGQWRTALGGTVDAYIQADVNLLSGFSGGPLIDATGRVAGFLSWYLANGQGIAIPAQTLRGIVQALRTHGRVRRGYLGIGTQPVALTPARQQTGGLEQASGALVNSVAAESPAERGGILVGDILVSLDGSKITGPEELRTALGPQVVDRAVSVVILRGGQRQELSVTPGSRE